MSSGDSLYSLIFGNPLSQALLTTATDVLDSVGFKPKNIKEQTIEIIQPSRQLTLWETAGVNNNFIRLAGISGAMAVMMGAYGKHMLGLIIDPKKQLEAKTVFEIASRYHCLHSIALLAMPLAHRPLVTGSLMAVGTLLFSGTNYYRALTGDKTFIQVTTFGGFCLVAAWLTLIF